MLEHLDWESRAVLKDRDDIEAEIVRLKAILGRFLVGDAAPLAQRAVVHLTGPWLFREVTSDETEAPPTIPTDRFGTVVVPDYRLYERGCYRCFFTDTPLPGKRLWLCFTAADYEMEVWADGVYVGRHVGYFSPFRFDITDYLKNSHHQIDVRIRRAHDWIEWDGGMSNHNQGDTHGKGLGTVVDDISTAGAGLLGPVTLEHVDSLSIEEIYVHGDNDQRTAVVSAILRNDDVRARTATLRARVWPRNGSAGRGDASQSVQLAAGTSGTIRIDVPVSDAQTWSPDTPHLYWLGLTLEDDHAVLDGQTVSFGFRTIERRSDGTFLLNGRPCFLRGTASIGCMWRAAWRGDESEVVDQLLRLKGLFANVMRLCVHVSPKLVYDCADRLGILIYQDAPHNWHCFAPNEGRMEDVLAQVDELVKFVRNHPSVIVYSLANEMHMTNPFHPADRLYLEEAYKRCAALEHNLVILQDHNGPDRPEPPAESFHQYPGYFTHTARSTKLVIGGGRAAGRAIISEYGAGAVFSWDAMQDVDRTHKRLGDSAGLLLPDRATDPWPVEHLTEQQFGRTLRQTQRWVGRRHSWTEYRAATNKHQARVLSFQTGHLRRSRDAVYGVIQHYFTNPSARLYNAWVDLAIMDHLHEPSDGYCALREAFRPLALDLVFAAQRAYAGQTIPFEIWLYNDYQDRFPALEVMWEWRAVGRDDVLDSGRQLVSADPDSVQRVLDHAVTVPHDCQPGSELRLVVQLQIDGRAWCERMGDIVVWPRKELPGRTIAVVGDVAEAMDKLAPLSATIIPFTGDEAGKVPVVVLPGVTLEPGTKASLWKVAATGGNVILLERNVDDDLTWVTSRAPLAVIAETVYDLVQPEAPLLQHGLDVDALSDWNTDDGRVVEGPLLVAGGVRWASCGDGLQESAIHEIRIHYGSVILCQVVVWRCLDREPAAWTLLYQLLTRTTDRESSPTDNSGADVVMHMESGTAGA